MAQRLATALGRVLHRDMDAGTAFRMVRLFRNWRDVVGDEVADLGEPLGHRDTAVLLAAEDSAAAQELTFHAPLVLERANAFLGKEYFDKVQVELLMGRVPLGGGMPQPKAETLQPTRPGRLGGLLGRLDPESAVGRCYAAYVRLFGPDKTGENEGSHEDPWNKEHGA